MLGIADRSKIFLLFQLIFQGNQKKSLDLLREMINEGLEPTSFLNDLLEIIYFIQQKKDLGNFDSELSISEAEMEIIKELSNDVDTPTNSSSHHVKDNAPACRLGQKIPRANKIAGNHNVLASDIKIGSKYAQAKGTERHVNS